MKRLAWALSALAGMLLLVFFLYVSVATFALTTESYPQEPPFNAMAESLVSYLKGDVASLPEDLFTPRESLHMIDVLALFLGAKRLGYACLLGAVPLLILSYLLGGRQKLGRGLLTGIAAALGLLLCLGIWAAIDFDGWFTAMHELVFTNDLWLLDPAESMLIEMLPLGFFIGAVKTVVFRFGLAALGLALTAVAIQRPNTWLGRKKTQ